MHDISHRHANKNLMKILDCTVDATDRLSAMRPLMGVKPNAGPADVAAAVTRPDAEVAGRLSQPRTCRLFTCAPKPRLVTCRTVPLLHDSVSSMMSNSVSHFSGLIGQVHTASCSPLRRPYIS